MASEGDDAERALVPAATLAGRLERLFEVRRSRTDSARSPRNSEVVAACRADGRELSESHLSELRRGVKTNPTVRVLDTLAWFFEVPVGYFTDDTVATTVYAQLARDQAAGDAELASQRRDQEEVAAAARDLQQAMRSAGVTRMGHRGGGSRNSKQQAAMMRALAQALRDEDDSDGSRDGGPPGLSAGGE